MLSGLQGQALRVEAEDVPSKGGVRAVVPEPCYDRSPTRTRTRTRTRANLNPNPSQVRAVVPEHCYRRSTLRSLGYLVCHAALGP